MDFDIPAELAEYLKQLDDFIEREIKPLERADDNIRFFDHRRENARTDWERGGLPRRDWETLLADRQSPDGDPRSATIATPIPANTAARMERIWEWPSSGSTSPPRGWGCTTTSRTSTPSSPTTSACCWS